MNFIILLDININPVPSCRFLDILLEPHLTGQLHAKYIINKCEKLANIIKFLRGVWWGSNPKTLLNIYKAISRGTSDYASFLFPFHNKSLTESFERVSRRTLRYCIDLRRSTPSNVVYAESCVGPARFRSDLLVHKFIFKFSAGPGYLAARVQTHFSPPR